VATPDVDPHERARIERTLDRIEERLAASMMGLHRAGPPASSEALRHSPLPGSARLVYARVDGLDVAMGESVLLPLEAIAAATARAREEGLVEEGDLVVAERGRELFVLPADPWAEGADVIGIDEGGDRRPEASTLAALALGWLVEASVVYGDDGEFRDDVFDEDGTPLPATVRRTLRRRLDADPDAPHPRLRLAQLLRAEGKARGAVQEIEQTLRRAPEYCWAHHELGRAHADLGEMDLAARAHARAAESTPDSALQAYFFAWAARRAEGEARERFAALARARRPDFAAGQAEGAQLRIDDEDEATARELVALGLAVAPHNVTLLDLRRRLGPGEPLAADSDESVSD
jgi:tetratricopeptide (TPR) repeat protein